MFVCTHNSARSQLAAALWRERTGRPVASAGTHPAARVHPRAVTVAHRHGLALDPTGTAHVADVVRDGDLVIAVCDNAHEDLTGAGTGRGCTGRCPTRSASTPTPRSRPPTPTSPTAIDRLAPALTTRSRP